MARLVSVALFFVGLVGFVFGVFEGFSGISFGTNVVTTTQTIINFKGNTGAVFMTSFVAFVLLFVFGWWLYDQSDL
jgi:type II secretory pathway component PulF